MYILNIISNPNLLFVLITLLMIVCATLIITSKNPIHSILYLVLIFIITTILFLILNVDFIAMLFLVLYVGAIVVLFLFVVMMLNVRILELNERIISYVPIAILIIFIFFILILSVVTINFVSESSENVNNNYSLLFSLKKYLTSYQHEQVNTIVFQDPITYNNLNIIAAVLYTDYIYIFVLAGMLLLIAMLGSIVLTLTHHIKNKKQDYYIQTNQTILKSIRHLK